MASTWDAVQQKEMKALPQTGWEQAPELPGTYEEYRSGWQEGFNKCRIGLGPVVPSQWGLSIGSVLNDFFFYLRRPFF